MDRQSVVCDLVELSRPLASILNDLNQLPWDFASALVKLEKRHVVSVLRRYLDSELDGPVVEMWANAIEGRDDIGYDPQSATGQLLHELANPLLTSPLSLVRAVQLLESVS